MPCCLFYQAVEVLNIAIVSWSSKYMRLFSEKL